MSFYHTPVFLPEAIDLLHVQQGLSYIDATLGGGGHTQEMLKKGGRVLGIDIDKDAIEYVYERNKNSENLVVVQGNFKVIHEIAHSHGFTNISGILFDLGVSSYQLENAERGFSFLHNGPLDMRMNTTLSVTAADLVNGLTKEELSQLFKRFGEEPYAEKIAQSIVKARQLKPIKTTEELSQVVRHNFSGVTRIHPGTRIFQALRIAVNDELHNLQESLNKSLQILNREGRIVVISFHSLEDRIVKNTFYEFEKQNKGKRLTKKPIMVSAEEMAQNRRSRSAKLRAFSKF